MLNFNVLFAINFQLYEKKRLVDLISKLQLSSQILLYLT